MNSSSNEDGSDSPTHPTPSSAEKSARASPIPDHTPADQTSTVDARPASLTAEAAPPPNTSPFRQLTGWRLVVVEAFLCLGLLLSIVDASIVATALVSIEDYFDEFFESIWVVLAYLLSYMVFALLWGRLSDVLGRKWMVVDAWAIFTAFSLACGLATSLNQLIAFRALQGVGGSGLYSLCNVLIPEITPRKHFATMSAATGVVFAISSVLGPVLGGVISEESTWRWIFLLNVPCGVVALVVLLICWPSPPNPYPNAWVPLRNLAHHVDILGTFLLIATSVLLIYALEEAGAAKQAWNSPVIISTLTLSGVCFLGLVAWLWLLDYMKGRIPINPILSTRILKNRILIAAVLSALFTGFPLFLTIIAIPERFQIVNALSSTDAGIRLMPLLFASAFGSTVGGLFSKRVNRTFQTLMVASCLMVVGCGLLSSVSDGFELEPALYGFQVIFGFGLGMTFTTVTIIASTESKFTDYASALGLVNQARILGGAIGLTASTIILNGKFVHELEGVLTSAQLTGLRQSLNYIPYLTYEQQIAVAETFARSFNDQMRYCTYVAAACVIISGFTFSKHPTNLVKRKALGQELLSGRISLAEADARCDDL